VAMKKSTTNAKAPKGIRDPNLSKDGKWRSFPKVPNLLQDVNTGTFYGRVTVDGKIYRESLETFVYSVAKQKLPDFVKTKLRKKRQVGAPATFGEARKLYEKDLENDHALSEMKVYGHLRDQHSAAMAQNVTFEFFPPQRRCGQNPSGAAALAPSPVCGAFSWCGGSRW
jgi:hypothetical protein